MKRKKSSPEHFHQLINDITAPILHKRGFQSPEIFYHWHDMITEIIGDDLATQTDIVKITFATQKRNNGTIHIACDPMAAMMIHQQKPAILQRINSYFGYQAIDNITIIQSKRL